MSAVATEIAARFQIGLNVTDLSRSVLFYRTLLGIEPSLTGSHQVRFELASPPVSITLTPGPQRVGGSLNHVGLRLADSAALVEVQRRLEEGGIATQRQEGVECCYARQSKFWVTDPDKNLWELYVLEDDIEHSGFEDAPPAAAAPALAVWEHRLTEPVPERLSHADASLDEVRLEGTWNARLESLRPASLLAEIFRVLRPGGKVAIHGLAGNRPLENPALPGLAALVQRVPGIAEMLDALQQAGFVGLYYEKLGDIACLPVHDVELREARLLGWRPFAATASAAQRVLYKGPLARVCDDAGTVFPRGVPVAVTPSAWQALQQGPAAGQFLFFPEPT
ncbi:MAG: VOC family protein [Planctomycetia bacterium]|nr:VOC family protein [Planctomycetia bacterium]